MSKLTYKIKHNSDLSEHLEKAKKVAKFSLKSTNLTSKDVKQFGLKSAISNQILRKYCRNKKLKKINPNKVKLIIPGQSIKFQENIINIPCLKLKLSFNKNVEKINQIEFDNEYAYICCTVKDEPIYDSCGFIGIDRNATGHLAVVAIDNKIVKLGKPAWHIRRKYKNIRRHAQKQKKHRFIKRLKNRESRIIRDINHKISRKIVNLAKENRYAIKLENLKGIRKKKQGKKLNYIKSNWSFYQLQQMIEYKAKLLGVTVHYIDPSYTSQTCSRCGLLGIRNKKLFTCEHCKHQDSADANAAFVIAKASLTPSRLIQDRDCIKSMSDNAQVAMV